jgi:hypothetical protein
MSTTTETKARPIRIQRKRTADAGALRAGAGRTTTGAGRCKYGRGRTGEVTDDETPVCPRCGREPKWAGFAIRWMEYWIMLACPRCGFHGEDAPTAKEALANWQGACAAERVRVK